MHLFIWLPTAIKSNTTTTMGSSKKHKKKSCDKDMEEHRRGHKKHRHKDREERDCAWEKDKRKRRSRERSGRESRKGERSNGGEPRVKKMKLNVGYEESHEEYEPKSAGRDASLSIEETNKLRAKLGLKPLELGESKKETGTKENPVVAETINPVVITQQKEIREMLAALKEKHILNKKLGKIKSLAGEDCLDDTAAWVAQTRKLEKEKELAEKRAKLLEEMDQEFGVSDLVEEEFGHSRKPAYSSRDLKGLKIQHKTESFAEGQTVILTLEDKGVLEEEEDVLVNVGLIDKERADKNVELKKKKPVYKPYDEEENVDDMITFKNRSVLSKYDEEIGGEKKKSFRLGAGGSADGEREKEFQAMRETLRSQAQSLEMPALTIASEYYTEQEMVGFKKTKRCVKNIRKKEKELIYILPDDTRSTDFGSRARGKGRKELDEKGSGKVKVDKSRMTLNLPQMSDDVRMAEMDISDDEDFAPPAQAVIKEDEAEEELHKQLQKQRKLRQKQLLKDSGEKVAQLLIKMEKTDGDNDPDKKNNIVLNATSDFCRILCDSPTYDLSDNREDQEAIMGFKQEEKKEDGVDSEIDENVGWSTVKLDEEQKRPDFPTTSFTILDEEPIINSGLATTLLLCKNKGILDTQKGTRVNATKPTLPNENYCIEDKMYFDDKYSRRQEYIRFTQDFKDKDGYRPDVKIEYLDESGCKLTPKEAFRQLSHRFHGIGSGKMKTERRMKKLSSIDTIFETVALCQAQREAQKTPFIVLSGGEKNMNANNIAK